MCPEGFVFFDKNRCVKLMASQADKSTADTECKNLGGNILTSKSKYSTYKLATFLEDQSSIDNIYLGMSKSDEQWIWDDTKTTVFAERKLDF